MIFLLINPKTLASLKTAIEVIMETILQTIGATAFITLIIETLFSPIQKWVRKNYK